MDAAMDAVDAARRVVQGIKDNQLFIISHSEFRDVLRARHAKIEASIAGRADQRGACGIRALYPVEPDLQRERLGACPGQRQAGQSVSDAGGHHRGIVLIDREIGDPRQPFLQKDFHFLQSQGCAHAAMNAVAQC